MSSDLRYFHNESDYLPVALRALAQRFETEEHGRSFYRQIASDARKNQFLRGALTYYYMVKQGNWTVGVMKEPVTYDEAQLERTLRIAFEDPAVFMVPMGIIRFDYGTTHAWRANLTRDNVKFVEYFFDGQSGSIENGLRRAILYRHEVLAAFPMTVDVRVGKFLDSKPENRISRHTEKGHLHPYVYWRATWYDANHKRKTKNFAVGKFGDAEAMGLALDAARENHNPVPKRHPLADPYTAERWRPLARNEVESSASRNEYADRKSHEDPAVNDSYPFGYEGMRRVRLHISIERDRTLRNKKVRQFLSEHGHLFCELCKMNFKDRYTFLKKDIIEVHHVLPLAQLSSSTLVEARDLMLLCPNCHTAIHQGDAVENLGLAIERRDKIAAQ